jgi:hypothetical protein
LLAEVENPAGWLCAATSAATWKTAERVGFVRQSISQDASRSFILLPAGSRPLGDQPTGSSG